MEKWKSHAFLCLTIIISLIIVLANYSKVFYGFEYEDSFINSAVAIDDSFSGSVLKFRACPQTEIELGEADGSEFYSGHYVPYAAYLWGLRNTLSIEDAHIMHRIGNLLLILTTLIGCFLICHKRNRSRTFLLLTICLCSFPVIYVLNSGLKENLSFCLGLLIVIVATRKERFTYLLFLLILMVTLVKRENLIYLLVPFIAVAKAHWFKIKFIAPFLVILIVQVLINPFYTEGLESNAIGRSTFSFDFLSYQGPTYLLSMVHWTGFFLVSIMLLVVKPGKKAMFMLAAWFILFLLYGSHYRSQYTIETREIDLFFTYRYMVNAVPLLLGGIMLSEERSWRWLSHGKKVVLIVAVGALCVFMNKVTIFSEDEDFNYHSSSEFIKENYDNCTVLDNFSLISRLDLLNEEGVDIRALDSNSMRLNWKEPVLILNRFESDPISSWLLKEDSLVKLGSPDLYLLTKHD